MANVSVCHKTGGHNGLGNIPNIEVDAETMSKFLSHKGVSLKQWP